MFFSQRTALDGAHVFAAGVFIIHFPNAQQKSRQKTTKVLLDQDFLNASSFVLT
jgi:hypothetical protein